MNIQLHQTRYEFCPICSSSILNWRTKKTDIGSFNIDRCKSCGYAFVNPRPSMQYLKEFYAVSGFRRNDTLEKSETYEYVVGKVRKEYPHLNIYTATVVKTILRLLNDNKQPDSNLLDVGCGYGYFSKEALQHGFKVTALELGAPERKIAEQMTSLTPIPVSFEEFEYEPNSFSVVLMTQVLEHAHDIELWISKAYNLLKKDGILLIALPNFGNIFRVLLKENDPFICPPAHLNFFSTKNLSLLLCKKGFKILKVKYLSMMPYSTFEKRLSGLGKTGLSVAYQISTMIQKCFDILHIGLVINIYTRKIENY